MTGMDMSKAVRYHVRDDGTMPYAAAKAAGRCQCCGDGGARVVAARAPGAAHWWLGVVCTGCLGLVRETGAVVVLAAEDGEPAPLGDAA